MQTRVVALEVGVPVEDVHSSSPERAMLHQSAVEQ
jgi:hypothetical protein